MKLIPLVAAFLAGQAVFVLNVPGRLLKPVPTPDQVLAKVGGTPITAKDVEPLLWEWRGKDALQDLISLQIAQVAADKAGVTVSDAEVQARLDEVMEGIRTRLQPGETLEQAMADEGTSPSRLYLRLRAETLLNRLVLGSFHQPDFVKVKTLIVPLAGSETKDLKAAIQTAELAYEEATKGKGWSEAIRRFAEDEGARQSDGLLGWRHWDAFPEGLRTTVMALPQGGISKPAQTAHGIQMFLVEKLGKDAKGKDLEELREAFVRSERPDLVKKLRAEVPVERLW